MNNQEHPDSTVLYLVRHAHAEWRPDDTQPLSLRGRSDARRVADLLAPRRAAAVYSSPSRRAVETVQCLAYRCGLEPVLVDDLRERLLPPAPPESFESAVQASWEQPDRAVEGGEPNRAAQARGRAALMEIARRHPGQRVVVATHGNLLALALASLDSRFGFAFWQGLTFPDVYEVVLDGAALIRASRLWSQSLPILETERLSLRPLSTEDAGFILELVNDPSFIENIGDRKVRSTEDARTYIRSRAMKTYSEQGVGTHAVVLKNGGTPIGVCGLLKRDAFEHHDIGFALLPRYWSKGYGLESAQGVLDHARETLGLQRIIAITSLQNPASIGLLEKLGFRFERVVSFEDEEVRLFSKELWATPRARGT